MPSSYLGGLALTSHNNALLNRSVLHALNTDPLYSLRAAAGGSAASASQFVGSVNPAASLATEVPLDAAPVPVTERHNHALPAATPNFLSESDLEALATAKQTRTRAAGHRIHKDSALASLAADSVFHRWN
jgi:hypothetical protein